MYRRRGWTEGTRARIITSALAVGLGVSAFGVLTESAGQSSPAKFPGITYGALKSADWAWLRLDFSRTRIAAMQIPWAVSPERCSNRKGYSSYFYGGFEDGDPIRLDAAGKFSKTVTDNYRDHGIRYKEEQTVTGTVRDQAASGSIRGRAMITRPDGRVVRCTFGPQYWSVEN